MPAQKRSAPEDRDGEDRERCHFTRRFCRAPEFDGTGRRKEPELIRWKFYRDGDGFERHPFSISRGDEPPVYPSFISVELPEIRPNVHCPICLGIIKKARAVMQCLHRFCQECIDKSMRMGNKECPVCRARSPSRRSMRDDPNYDALISIFYPDIEKYEEEEEENECSNKDQSPNSIISKQAEALAKIKRSGTKVSRPWYRRQAGTRLPHSFLSNSSSDGGYHENVPETTRRRSHAIGWESEMLGRDRSTAGSTTQHGDSSNRVTQTDRISKFVKRFQNPEQNKNKRGVYIMLISLDLKSTPSLQQPYLCCWPNISTEDLYEYISCQTPLQPNDIEIFYAKRYHGIDPPVPSMKHPHKDDWQIMERRQILGGDGEIGDSLILGYRKKPRAR